MSTISTYTGKVLDFNKPTPGMFDIEDIAHALSLICRFNGHVSEFYSVAEHSVLGCLFVDGDLLLPFLLHDASEAYIADIVTPAKALLKDYQVVERRLQTAIAGVFGVDPGKFDDPRLINIDRRMCTTERNQLQPLYDREVWGDYDQKFPPIHVRLQCFSPAQAKSFFLRTFRYSSHLAEMAPLERHLWMTHVLESL